MTTVHRIEFLQKVKDEFPQLASEINAQGGILSFELGVLIRFLQKNIDEGEREQTSIIYALLNQHFVNGNKDLRSLIGNAISEDVILENSNKRNRSWAVESLPKELRDERQNWFKFMGWKNKVWKHITSPPSSLRSLYSLRRTRLRRASCKGVMYIKATKYLLVFVLGLSIGIFGHEVLMRNVHHNQIADIFTQNELNEIERFLKYESSTEAARYCLLYRSAQYGAYRLSLKIDGAKKGDFQNHLILGNIENFNQIIEKLTSLKKEGLRYNCEDT